MAGPSPLQINNPTPGSNFLETQIGAVAYLFGIINNGTQISFQGVPSFELQSDDITSTWDEKKNKDTTGNTQNIQQTDFRYEREIEIIPSGATRAAANAVADTVIALGTVTVANYKVTSFNGTWRVRPGTRINLKMDENGTIRLPVEKYTNAQQNTALTGAAIAG